MEVDVRQSSSYKYLTQDGKKPVKVNSGFSEVDADFLAEQANAICSLLSGKGLNFYQIALILDTAKDGLRECRLKKPY